MTSYHLIDLLSGAALKSFGLLGTVALIMLAWRRGAAAARHFAWFGATVALLFLPLAPWVAPRWKAPEWTSHAAFMPGWILNRDANAPPNISISGQANRVPSDDAVTKLAGDRTRAEVVKKPIGFRAYLLCLWLGGLSATLLGCLVRFWGLRRIKRNCGVLNDSRAQKIVKSAQDELRLKRKVRVLRSENRVMPMTWGSWRPVVLLPSEAATWGDAKLEMVLRHELAHVKRWDCLTQNFAEFVCALYWFNPLVWLAARQMRGERERACDDLVLQTGALPSEYAGHLLEIARQFACSGAIAAIPIARPSGLERRVRDVVDARRQRGGLRPVTAVFLVAALAGLFCCAGGCKTKAAEAENAATTSRDGEELRQRQMLQIEAFSQAKEKQAEALAAGAGEQISPIFQQFFAAAIQGDVATVTNMYFDFKNRHPQYSKGDGKVPSRTVQALEMRRLEAQIQIDNYSNVLTKLTNAQAVSGSEDYRRKFGDVIEGTQAKIDKAKTLCESIEKREAQIQGATDLSLSTSYWSPVLEICLAYFDVAAGEPKYTQLFVNGIVRSIPPGGIYFGGTDPGRGLITAFSKSHADADPFFTLTQNALADNTYLQYLQTMCGGKIYIPTTNDSQNCFQKYCEDAQRRLEHDTQFPNEPRLIKPGEEVSMKDGKIQVTGQVAVMAINGLLAKIIFDKNSARKFYIEESFPLDWMYPYLEPHGIIMKINREPLAELGDDIVKRNQDYWSGIVSGMIGDWLTPDTPLETVVDFAEQTFTRQDLSNFKGDPRFISNDDAMRMFSKQRSSIAGLYAWRMNHASDPSEKDRMARAADLAWRQAWAICPYSSETARGLAHLLVSENRIDYALLVAETAGRVAMRMGEPGAQIRDLIKELRQQRK